MFKFHLYLSRKKLNPQTGLAPVYAKISIEGNTHPIERSSGVLIYPKYWSNEFKRVNSACIGATEINQQIAEFEAKLHDLTKKTSDIRVIDSILKSKAQREDLTAILLTSVIEHYIEYKKTTVGKPDGVDEETIKTYNSRKKNVVAFLDSIGKPAMLITDFNISMGDKFRSYLFSKGFSKSYTQKHLLFIQTLITYSSNEFGTANTNFLNIVLKKPSPNEIVYLSESELSSLYTKKYFSQLSQKTADLFLLQCYTGMSYSDVIQLNLSMIEIFKGRYFISYLRKKTNQKALVPLHPLVRNILGKYNGHAPKLSNQQFNRVLKEVAESVGISKKLTSHVGRKTFATMQINNGMSVEAVTKMLGKTNVRETTQVYAQIGHQLLINHGNIFNQTTLFHQ